MKITVFRKDFNKHFALSSAENSASGPLNRGRIADLFTFGENIICNSPTFARAKFQGGERHLCFISVRTFGSLKSPFITITSLPELDLRERIFVLLV